MKLFKTNLVQAQEDIQEIKEVIAIIESCQNNIINSMVVPSRMLGGRITSSSTSFPSKTTMIKIDITKLP